MQQLVSGFPKYLSYGRNQNRYIHSIFAVPLVSLAVAASLSLEDPLILKMKQSIHTIGALDIYISALPAITAAGTAPGDKLFPPECQAAISSVSGNHLYFCSIDKQRLGPVSLNFSVLLRRRRHSLP
jgi:hypothetical protein